MRLLSAKGEKSTRLERSSFIAALLIAAAIIAPGIKETVQTNQLLAKADPAVLKRCQDSSSYASWRFWSTNVQAYSNCIVLAKDAAVQDAAGKYLLHGTEGKFTFVPSNNTIAVPPASKGP